MSKLQREVVINTALNLLNEVGIDQLTTRKLADRLGVQQPALYWHFKNKHALLEALAQAMLEENHLKKRLDVHEDWRDFLYANAHSFRNALLAYRDGARIHAGTRPSAHHFEHIEAQIKILCEAGFTFLDASMVLVTLSHYVVGAVLEQQANIVTANHTTQSSDTTLFAPSSYMGHLLQDLEPAKEDLIFQFGLSAMIEGAAVRLQASSPKINISNLT